MKKTLLFCAAAALLVTACTTPAKNTAIGAGIGAAGGAAAGAIIAKTTGGNAGQGAVWGAAAGAVLGGGIGNYFDKQAKELAAIATVTKTDDGLIITLKNEILFDSGSSQLSAAAKKNIADIGKVLKKYPCNVIEVAGHTDNTGTASYNKTLSQQRADAVLNELVANGVKTAGMAAVGYGITKPIASNNTADGRTQNRRVNLNITANSEYVKQYCSK